jgi:hypothetical protein
MRRNHTRRSASLMASISILALFALSLAIPQSASAATSGQSAQGIYRFLLEDGHTKQVEFDAHTQADGTTVGQMNFRDEAAFPDQDVDGAGAETPREPGVYLTVDFDCMTVERNKAVICGTIRDSNLSSYIGQRVLLVVEDNGDNPEAPDKLTWGFYKPAAGGWTPSDAELREDEGVGLTWTATDAERRDDEGVPSHPSTAINCQRFPVSSYSFVDVEHGEGSIQVQP